MKKSKLLSMTSMAVLKAVADGYRYGFDIMDATDLPSGTVYPILGRLAKAGSVQSRWEQSSIARREKRPPRRYYVLTEAGRQEFEATVLHYQTLGGRMAATPGLEREEA